MLTGPSGAGEFSRSKQQPERPSPMPKSESRKIHNCFSPCAVSLSVREKLPKNRGVPPPHSPMSQAPSHQSLSNSMEKNSKSNKEKNGKEKVRKPNPQQLSWGSVHSHCGTWHSFSSSGIQELLWKSQDKPKCQTYKTIRWSSCSGATLCLHLPAPSLHSSMF